MASESKSSAGEPVLLDRDTTCSMCVIQLMKYTPYFTEYTDINGSRVVECDRCSAQSAAERAELAELAGVSYNERAHAADIYAAECASAGLLSQADMVESIGGAADFASWFGAARETFGDGYEEPDMDGDFERIRAQSAAEMAAAAGEWKEKTVYFTAPCDVGHIENGADYDNWAHSAVETMPSKEMTYEKQRWLGMRGASASGGAGAAGAAQAASGTAGAAGAAGAASGAAGSSN